MKSSNDYNEFAPSISGRFAIHSSDFYTAWFNEYPGCSNGIDVYIKSEYYYASSPFRTKSLPGGVPELKIFPNPFTEELTVVLPSSEANENSWNLSITDVFGKIIFENKEIKQEKFIYRAAREVTAGIYFLKITDIQSNVTTSFKIVKQ